MRVPFAASVKALQNHNIEVFELKSDANEFRVQGADPNPPYTGLIKLNFSIDDIKILDREGQARRRRSKSEFRFDSLPEILRAVGKYVDDKRAARLRWVNNCCLSDQDEIQLEYQTRAGDIRAETLSMSAIRETAVDMYSGGYVQKTDLPSKPHRYDDALGYAERLRAQVPTILSRPQFCDSCAAIPSR